MFREPLTSICDYVPNNIISRANLGIEDMRRVWFILREPFPHCNVSIHREDPNPRLCYLKELLVILKYVTIIHYWHPKPEKETSMTIDLVASMC